MKRLQNLIKNTPKEKLTIIGCIAVAVVAITACAIIFTSGALRADRSSSGKESEEQENTAAHTASPLSSDSIEFQSLGNNTCSVVGIGEFIGTELSIPEKSPSGERVVRIADSAFKNCSSLVSIYIHQYISYIGEGAFRGCGALVAINVNSSNMNYCSSGGILFSKDKINLICYPSGRYGNTYLIDPSVRIIGAYAFEDMYHLSQLLYEGSTSDFEAIEICRGNDDLLSLPITCNYTPAK